MSTTNYTVNNTVSNLTSPLTLIELNNNVSEVETTPLGSLLLVHDQLIGLMLYSFDGLPIRLTSSPDFTDSVGYGIFSLIPVKFEN